MEITGKETFATVDVGGSVKGAVAHLVGGGAALSPGLANSKKGAKSNRKLPPRVIAQLRRIFT